jgi:hypothetical protein
MAQKGSKSNTFALTVGTTPQILVRANPKRVCLYVYNNTSGKTAYILSAQNKSAAQGMPVAYQERYKNQFSTCEYWIVASAAGTDVRVEEISE